MTGYILFRPKKEFTITITNPNPRSSNKEAIVIRDIKNIDWNFDFVSNKLIIFFTIF